MKLHECAQCGTSHSAREPECSVCGVRLPGATESFTPIGTGHQDDVIGDASHTGPLLVVSKGPEAGERFYLEGTELSVGRDPKSSIFLNDMTVSRTHATLHIDEEGVSIRDSGSLNGTHVNGMVIDVATLSDGDIVQIGMFRMVFIAGGDRT